MAETAEEYIAAKEAYKAAGAALEKMGDKIHEIGQGLIHRPHHFRDPSSIGSGMSKVAKTCPAVAEFRIPPFEWVTHAQFAEALNAWYAAEAAVEQVGAKLTPELRKALDRSYPDFSPTPRRASTTVEPTDF